MGLAPYLGRERSHDLVYDICGEVCAGNGIFLDLLAAHPRSRRTYGVMHFPLSSTRLTISEWRPRW